MFVVVVVLVVSCVLVHRQKAAVPEGVAEEVVFDDFVNPAATKHTDVVATEVLQVIELHDISLVEAKKEDAGVV